MSSSNGDTRIESALANCHAGHWQQALGCLALLDSVAASWPALALQLLAAPAKQAEVGAGRLLQRLGAVHWSVEPAEAAPTSNEVLLQIVAAGQRHCLVIRRHPLQLVRLHIVSQASDLIDGIRHEA